MFKDTLRQKDKIILQKTGFHPAFTPLTPVRSGEPFIAKPERGRERECESTNKTDILIHNELSECINERNKLQEILENELDVNSKLEDIVYKLQMNIKKIERNSIPPLGRDSIHESEKEEILASPPRVIKNAKISGKKVYIKKEKK